MSKNIKTDMGFFDRPIYKCATCGRTMSAMERFNEFGTYSYGKIFYCGPECARLTFLSEEELKEAIINYVKDKFGKTVVENQVKVDPKGFGKYGAIIVGIKRNNK